MQIQGCRKIRVRFDVPFVERKWRTGSFEPIGFSGDLGRFGVAVFEVVINFKRTKRIGGDDFHEAQFHINTWLFTAGRPFKKASRQKSPAASPADWSIYISYMFDSFAAPGFIANLSQNSSSLWDPRARKKIIELVPESNSKLMTLLFRAIHYSSTTKFFCFFFQI